MGPTDPECNTSKLWSILELDTSSFAKILLKGRDLISRKKLFLCKLLPLKLAPVTIFNFLSIL
jgi:hypothetical protein